MPELAEVEYYRKQWDVGLGQSVAKVELHPATRVFRGTEFARIVQSLPGLKFRQSWARGKQMLFRFGKNKWLGLHLGMTGKLRTEKLPFQPNKHDHLVIMFKRIALVFSDPRQFGRVRFDEGPSAPEWWMKIPPAPNENAFTKTVMRNFLLRHRRLPIKATLLIQAGFPGIGNWMADEILWQAKIAPLRPTAELRDGHLRTLWKATRFVCRTAMRTVGNDFSDPPKGWLFHVRWSQQGHCPRHKIVLRCATIGGRTTVWCAKCQPA